MEKEQVSGKFDEAKGKVKEEWGKATNDPATQGSGLADQVKGKAEQAYGNVKDNLNKDADDTKD